MRIYIALFVFLFAFSANASGGTTGLKIPRFVSLKADTANVRLGPSLRYEIKWQLVRRSLPLEVIAEFEQWRKVRDVQGDEGWIHRAILSGRRTATIIDEVQVLRQKPNSDSKAVVKAEVGVTGMLKKCVQEFCQLNVGKYTGWVNKKYLFGAYEEEIF